MPLNILLADDHAILREGIRTIVNQIPGFQVVAEAADGFEAIEKARKLQSGIVLLDVGMPRVNGIRATLQITKQSPAVKVIILSMYDDETTVMEAIRAGAKGYILKNAPATTLRAALQAVARGESYLCPGVASKVMKHLHQPSSRSGATPLQRLTPRERDVLRLVAEGQTSKEIAQALSLGVETVRGYRKALMSKLGVHNVAGLTQFALANGLGEFTVRPDFSTLSSEVEEVGG
jgi:DNA-binding NarL/FixJ family response regulator